MYFVFSYLLSRIFSCFVIVNIPTPSGSCRLTCLWYLTRRLDPTDKSTEPAPRTQKHHKSGKKGSGGGGGEKRPQPIQAVRELAKRLGMPALHAKLDGMTAEFAAPSTQALCSSVRFLIPMSPRPFGNLSFTFCTSDECVILLVRNFFTQTVF